MGETRLSRVRARGDELVELGVLEKRASSPDVRLPPMLLLHGATFGAQLFDLPRPGYSLMDELAGVGRAVYALNVRGYGNSLASAIAGGLPSENLPFAGANEALGDIAATANFILEREGVPALDLVGFSWGTITAARYAAEHPEKVARLGLYAPLYGERNAAWLDRIADPQRRSRLAASFGAFRLVTLADVVSRWDSDLPLGNSARYREEGIPELLFETFSALDPESPSRTPCAFRCPNGALADMVDVFNGRPLYDPSKLIMPLLLLRGADDTTSTDSDARRLLANAGSREKDYRVISPGSHFLCIERNRSKLYEALRSFFGPLGARARVSGTIS